MTVWEAIQTLGAMLAGFAAACVVLYFLARWAIFR